MIFVNYKTYEEGSGDRALELTKILEKVAKNSQIKIIPVVQSIDLKEIVANTSLEVWVQKVDEVDFGAHTGSVVPKEVLDAGAHGTFLNHSENKIENFDSLKDTVKLCREIGLKTLVFAGNIEELKKNLDTNPDFISYEPPELVGSKTTSVSESKPEIIGDAVNISKDAGIPLIVGAGIKSGEDIRKGLELGAAGFAVASSIVASSDPEKALMELIEGYK
ncbi:MAG TPA: triose-phosphate isomerase [Candidatus Saccharimonadales bacterium]|nr:triose-phosphate isomerase [Candidatus Saccharimonadales bacterium]